MSFSVSLWWFWTYFCQMYHSRLKCFYFFSVLVLQRSRIMWSMGMFWWIQSYRIRSVVCGCSTGVLFCFFLEVQVKYQKIVRIQYPTWRFLSLIERIKDVHMTSCMSFEHFVCTFILGRAVREKLNSKFWPFCEIGAYRVNSINHLLFYHVISYTR